MIIEIIGSTRETKVRFDVKVGYVTSFMPVQIKQLSNASEALLSSFYFLEKKFKCRLLSLE